MIVFGRYEQGVLRLGVLEVEGCFESILRAPVVGGSRDLGRSASVRSLL